MMVRQQNEMNMNGSSVFFFIPSWNVKKMQYNPYTHFYLILSDVFFLKMIDILIGLYRYKFVQMKVR